MDMEKESYSKSHCIRGTDGSPSKAICGWDEETKQNRVWHTSPVPGVIGNINRQNASNFTISRQSLQPQGWTSWIVSIVLGSLLLTMFRELNYSTFFPRKSSEGITILNGTIEDSAMIDTGPSPYKSTLPTLRRRTSCDSGGSQHTDYNLSLRIGAVFIILSVSTLACAFPILATKFPGLRMPSDFFFAVRHFGTGVLIATAFVHLLPTAFTLLGDPCLSSFWTDDYPAMPGAIALAGIFFVTIIEMLLHPARSTPRSETTDSPEQPISAKRPLQGRQESIGRSLSGIVTGGYSKDEITQCEASNNNENKITMQNAKAGGQGNSPAILTPEQKHKKEIMHCLLLEMGILFHSVFIGMALSVSIGGSEFVVLLVAITFHQTFEGLALGARIAAIEWPKKSSRPIFMALAYGCTTPIGQAIGLAARSAYSPESEVGLILVGVMNAISSGLLVFASLVELLSEDLLSDESWRVLRGRRRVCAFLLVVAGAFAMSLVGAWA
ncbi:ZIP zinc transporter-domain-containing protein [Camillea tinctor]|nr:ZIP zinc transporter-domain-containing protein [Camillea tinctor]